MRASRTPSLNVTSDQYSSTPDGNAITVAGPDPNMGLSNLTATKVLIRLPSRVVTWLEALYDILFCNDSLYLFHQ
jgi:hypothetical protein